VYGREKLMIESKTAEIQALRGRMIKELKKENVSEDTISLCANLYDYVYRSYETVVVLERALEAILEKEKISEKEGFDKVLAKELEKEENRALYEFGYQYYDEDGESDVDEI